MKTQKNIPAFYYELNVIEFVQSSVDWEMQYNELSIKVTQIVHLRVFSHMENKHLSLPVFHLSNFK